MFLNPAALLVCIAFAIPGSDGECKVGGKTYQVGEEWKEAFKCVGHTCLQDGTYNTTTCSPVSDEIPDGWTLKPENPEAGFFPWCCEQAVPPPTPTFDYSLPGCTVGKKTFKVGEQNDLPGMCYYNACKGNDTWTVSACPVGIEGVPTGWDIIPDDPSKPYPECCGRGKPPLDIETDVVDKVQPRNRLDVTYGKNIEVKHGNKLTPTQVKNQPSVHYRENPKAFYLLCMVGPDAPSRQNPKFRETLHWLVGNIPGKAVSAGEVLAAYIGSGPPKGSGLHRYVFLLYKQPGKLNFDQPRLNNTTAEGRGNFSIRKFAQKYNLGDPIAVNVYQAEYDDYVPELNKQVGYDKIKK